MINTNKPTKQKIKMEANIMKRYYKYMEDSAKLKVGVYEASHLAAVCGINLSTLIFLGAMANAQEAPVKIKTGWYIYSLEERILGGEPVYYFSVDNYLE